MRNFLSLVLSFMIILAAVPTVSLFYKDEIKTKLESTGEVNASTTKEANETKASSESATALKDKKTNKVRVYLHKQKKTVKVSKTFYGISVLAKEIDIDAPEQALKAQAVCIFTFLKRCSEQLKDKPYDITDNPAVHQSFLEEDALKKFWGEAYKTNYRKLEKIVKSVLGLTLTFHGEPILAAYHSCNAGKTESAENYWGQAYTYLEAVPSPGDTLCPTCRSEAVLTAEEFKKKLSALKEKPFRFSDSPSDWLGEISITPSGTVLTATVASVPLSGRELREIFQLKSSFFTLSYRQGKFVFAVSGYGHGVGLSQEGAKYMARVGFDYRQILLHYYKGVEIQSDDEL